VSKAQSELVTKAEAMQIISRHLRKKDLDVGQLIKLVALQAKIAGWSNEKEPTDETNLDKLITEIERRRKAQ
jgi:hypothetical protein